MVEVLLHKAIRHRMSQDRNLVPVRQVQPRAAFSKERARISRRQFRETRRTHVENSRIDNVHHEHCLEQGIGQLRVGGEKRARFIRRARDEDLRTQRSAAFLSKLHVVLTFI